jgi:outer membrane protein OmpA-like peptidoglycan-associated protein
VDVTGDIDGDVRVLSAMINGMLDFGEDGDWNGYVGGGVGLASVKYHIDETDPNLGDSDGTFAWQVIAGVRKAVSSNIELGLKYRSSTRPSSNWRQHRWTVAERVSLAFAAGEPDLQLRSASATASASASASAAASGDADLHGWLGDPGDGNLSAAASAASAASASAGAGTRLSKGLGVKSYPGKASALPGFLFARCRCAHARLSLDPPSGSGGMRALGLAIMISLLASASVAQPATAPGGPWMVFFDWGKPEVRSDDQPVLDEVAATYRAKPAAHLQLAGHTDRSGSAAVNRVAGLRRAETIRTELGEARSPPEGDRHRLVRGGSAAGSDRGRGARSAEPAGRD